MHGTTAANQGRTPKECPSCAKTTIKAHRHDITSWVDEAPAEVIAWQCIYCGAVFDRSGASGKLLVSHHERIVLAPGQLEALRCYETTRKAPRARRPGVG